MLRCNSLSFNASCLFNCSLLSDESFGLSASSFFFGNKGIFLLFGRLSSSGSKGFLTLSCHIEAFDE